MTTSQKLRADCDRLTAELQTIRNFIRDHAVHLDKFGVNSSVGQRTMQHTLFMHDCPDTETAKAFARAVGGEWHRENSSEGGRDYRQKSHPIDIVIFGAEAPQPSEVIAL